MAGSVEKIKSHLIENGALYALMSGSGPSVFGVFDSSEVARIALEKIKNMGIRAYYSESVNAL